jgi:hypothetical protein
LYYQLNREKSHQQFKSIRICPKYQ